MRASDITAVARSKERPIVHLLAPAPVGGLETVVASLARAQIQSGCPTVVVAVGSSFQKVEPFLDSLDDSVPSQFLKVPVRGYLRERRAVVEILEDLDARLLHTHGQRVDVVDATFAARRGFPVVSTAHGFSKGGLKSRFYRYLQLRCWRDIDAVVAVSNPLARELRSSGVQDSRVHVVPNAWEMQGTPLPGPEARSLLGVDQAAFHLGWIGRLSREKGPDIFLEALENFATRYGPFMASFVGDGPLKDELQAHAVSLEVQDRVRWHGSISGAWRLLGGFDAVVISSRTEGTPMVLLEAMSQGIPVIASRVGGIPHTLYDEEGYLVSPGDSEALARTIGHVAQNLAGARIRAERARERIVHERSLNCWIRRYEDVYRMAE